MIGLALRAVKARWFPYVAIGVFAVVTGAYGYGRITGHAAGVLKMTQAMDKALLNQHRQMSKVIEQEGNRALKAERLKNDIQNRIHQVPDNDCSVDSECVHFYDDVLRATPSSFSGPHTYMPQSGVSF